MMTKWKLLAIGVSIVAMAPLAGQQGAKNGEWRYYGADAGNTKYSPLDQINETNVKNLQIAWRWKSVNFGRRPESNWQQTPLMVNGRLYFLAGLNRTAVSVNAATGETLWTYRHEEGERGARAVRTQNRGLAYWTDGKAEEKILFVTPGYQLIALNSKTGLPIPGFGKDGVVDLFEGLDRPEVKPGQIGLTSPPVIVGNVIVVGAALAPGPAPPSKTNVPGYIRGYDVRTGRRVWTFKTIPQLGELGNETWENDSWKYTGNTGAWAPLAVDEELGYVYVPVEMPTGDHYGGHRLGDNLFGDSLVCLDAKTGKRVWHYQLLHHDVWDWDIPSPPILVDVMQNGRKIKAVAQPTKQAFLFVFDRVTGKPLWPIEERPVAPSDVPGERMSKTQPFPTKPAAFDRQGVSLDDLIDFTPELKAEAVKIASRYKLGPLFTPPIMADSGGLIGTLMLPTQNGAVNWPGGAVDPETGILYVSSQTNPVSLSIVAADPARSDMGYVGRLGTGGGGGGRGGAGGGGGQGPGRGGAPGAGGPGGGGGRGRVGIGPGGLPLVKPPWGRVTAIDLNTGDHVWMVANGKAPDFVANHPLMKGIDLSNTGRPERAPLMVTKTLLFTADGSGLSNAGPGAGGPMFRALDKKTGKVIHEMELPASTTGVPMTYAIDGKQYIVVAIGAAGFPGELVALTLP